MFFNGSYVNQPFGEYLYNQFQPSGMYGTGFGEGGGGGMYGGGMMQPPMLPQAPQAQPQAQMPQAPSLANLYQQGMAPQQDGRMFGMWMR